MFFPFEKQGCLFSFFLSFLLYIHVKNLCVHSVLRLNNQGSNVTFQFGSIYVFVWYEKVAMATAESHFSIFTF